MKTIFQKIIDREIPADIIYEDDDLIVVNKPPQLLTIPDRHQVKIPSVGTLLQRTYDTIIPVNRLDRDTSGLVCFARNTEAHRYFSLAFQNRDVHKYYLALVLGKPNPENGTIDKPLLSLPNRNQVRVSREGKQSITHYETIYCWGPYSKVSLKIITGRTHQIRVHLSEIGHALMVDPTYGGRDAWYLSEVKRNYRSRGQEQPLLVRTPLHAEKLTIPLPSGGKITLEAPIPKDMRAVMNQLDKICGAVKS